MEIFTFWNQNKLTGKYLECFNLLKEVYPDIKIYNFISPEGKNPSKSCNLIRIQKLKEIKGSALYVDMDCFPGTEKFTETDDKRLAFANIGGGDLDTWAIFKPEGSESQVDYIIENYDKYYHLQVMANRGDYGIIEGYPSYRYFNHLYQSNY
jgi:hypothetical protein